MWLAVGVRVLKKAGRLTEIRVLREIELAILLGIETY